MRNTILICFMVLSSASFAKDSLFENNTTEKIILSPVSCSEMLIAYEEYLSNEK